MSSFRPRGACGTRRFEGGTPTRLPFVGQDGQAPVVSRTFDGRRRRSTCAVSQTAISGVDRVFRCTASSPPVSAISTTRFDGIPNLSPDGQRVAFLSNRSGESEIWVSAPDGSNAVQVTSMAVLPGFPRWSPDGQSIVFHGDPRARPDVLVVPARGGKPTNLTEKMLNAGFPSFSRDGQWIYFKIVQSQEGHIWKMPAAGGTPFKSRAMPERSHRIV